MKKGFTLIELLAVIAILGITITIVAVRIDKNIKNVNEFAVNEQKNLIERAAYLYAEEYTSELTDFNTTKVGKVSISTLISKGLLKSKDVKEQAFSTTLFNSLSGNKYFIPS